MTCESRARGPAPEHSREEVVKQERSTGDPHDALMANLDWNVKWLDHHEHWWMRLERWRREGRAA